MPASSEAGVFVLAMPIFALRQVTWLLLLPWIYGMAKAAVELLAGLNLWAPKVVALAAGATIAIIAARLFSPFWVAYVAGHELTHALWALLFGKVVTAIKIRKTGGHVVLSGTNSLITLAPYFFPFYGVIWLIVVSALNRWTLLQVTDWVIAFGMGGTYMLHFLMTAKVLRFRQPDIESEGCLFSAVTVILGNLAMGLVLCPIALGSLRFGQMIAAVWENAGWCIDWAAVKVGRLTGLVWTL